MHHPEIRQVPGGKKHLYRKGSYYCGMSGEGKFVGHLQSELDLDDETFCRHCVRTFWRLYNNGH